MHGFMALSWILQAVKCQAVSSPRYVTMNPVNRYNTGVMFSNIIAVYITIIYKVSYGEIKHSDSNTYKELTFVKFIWCHYKIIYQLDGIIFCLLACVFTSIECHRVPESIYITFVKTYILSIWLWNLPESKHANIQLPRISSLTVRYSTPEIVQHRIDIYF